MAKKVVKPKSVAKFLTKIVSSLGNEITGCVHIVENGKVPPKGKDRVGDKYMDTADRDTLTGRYQPQTDDFVNTDAEFETMFARHPSEIQNNQEIMFFLKDENNPNPISKGGTDGWMVYDSLFIRDNEGSFFILQRKFYDGQFKKTDPADGFKKVLHHDIITHLGRHSDKSVCILISIRDINGKIIDKDGMGGEPPGVGTKIPED
jgi:hypothetical protein